LCVLELVLCEAMYFCQTSAIHRKMIL
jgi:hypothetical protein